MNNHIEFQLKFGDEADSVCVGVATIETLKNYNIRAVCPTYYYDNSGAIIAPEYPTGKNMQAFR